MTGFGRSCGDVDGRPWVFEIKTVNHKYQDIRFRLPSWLTELEEPLRRQISAAIGRGRVEVSVTALSGDDPGVARIEVDLELAQALVDAHTQLADALDVPVRLDTRVLSGWHGVLTPVRKARDANDVMPEIMPLFQHAIEALVAMRDEEGSRLEQVLRKHIAVLGAHVADVEKRAPEISLAYQTRLEMRMAELLERVSVEVDSRRILQEVAVFSERCDVAEELARMRGHLGHVETLIEADASDAVGRRLDFLCQEMLREVNTIGSKIQDPNVTRSVVSMKSELERFREQIQNVE